MAPLTRVLDGRQQVGERRCGCCPRSAAQPRALTALRRQGRRSRAGARAATASPSSPSASSRARRTTSRSST
ncbi:MAG: hypothetical protein MZW92_28325 [Comamonadaceae bacterium]|nr:hypothetical protein [Comamonadaceae bacterium]